MLITSPVPSECQFVMTRIASELGRVAFRFTDEKGLHLGIAQVLDGLGVAHQREVAASAHERFDFLLEDGLVIEVKCDGALPEALRQIDRYLQLESVRALILVTTKRWDRMLARGAIRGKPLAVVNVRRVAF